MLQFVRLGTGLMLIGLCLASAIAQQPARAALPPKAVSVIDEYRLAPADVLQIEVFGEAELTDAYTISESGKINFPLVGTIDAVGRRAADLESELAAMLKKGYLLNPRVTVTVTSYRSIFVNGQVTNPGVYKFEPGFTVRKAITMAGGFTERASKKKLYVVGADSSAKPRKVKLEDVIRPGDVITVEESFF
jgi:polysaccharide biosynthesis/export protein VpsN